ncbi:MAG TPA: lipid II flippase MurJ, partial [Candidatus Peribacteria bacterium]|nr:lipid II flippase MurJ [Candidatus Peribacteria bacterium]
MKRILSSLRSQRRIAGGAAVLAGTQLAASVCGFLRDQAFSLTFPLGKDPIGVASVYIAAFRPSDLLFQVFVMSSLSVILVPFLAAHLAHKRTEEMNSVTTSTLILFGAGFGAVALLMALFFPLIAPSMTKFTGPSLELYIKFGRIALLTNFLFVFGNTVGQYLITVQKYWIYGITPILWAAGTIGGTYLLTPYVGPMGPIYGTLIGTIVYVIVRLLGVMKAGFRFRVPHGVIHPEWKQMGWLIIPRMGALGALQLQLLLLDRLGSGLGNSMVAVNQFASNFESVIPGIVGIAIAQSAFSLLSQSAAKGDFKRFKNNIVTGMWFNLAIAIPGAVVLAFCAPVAVWLLHLQGETARLFTAALVIYAIAVPFESTNHILLRAFYSLKNTLWPAVSSVVSCTMAVATGYLLLDSLGLYALAVAYIVAQIAQAIFLG